MLHTCFNTKPEGNIHCCTWKARGIENIHMGKIYLHLSRQSQPLPQWFLIQRHDISDCLRQESPNMLYKYSRLVLQQYNYSILVYYTLLSLQHYIFRLSILCQNTVYIYLIISESIQQFPMLISKYTCNSSGFLS